MASATMQFWETIAEQLIDVVVCVVSGCLSLCLRIGAQVVDEAKTSSMSDGGRPLSQERRERR